jgi:hypothetical protein
LARLATFLDFVLITDSIRRFPNPVELAQTVNDEPPDQLMHDEGLRSMVYVLYDIHVCTSNAVDLIVFGLRTLRLTSSSYSFEGQPEVSMV